MAELLAVVSSRGGELEAADGSGNLNKWEYGRDAYDAMDGTRRRRASIRTSSKMALEIHLLVFTAPAKP
jgi:hypothetical protein